MRITAEAKSATRQRILEVAERLFRTQGFEATTTRDIAHEAQIATGTLFNYFATKEAIVTELVTESLGRIRVDFDKQAGQTETLEEALFALIAGELRRIRPFRKYIVSILETALCPLAASQRNACGEQLRQQHLESVAGLARQHGFGDLSAVALQLYWTLYTGVLTFWAADRSPKQEDTLALIDQSLAMFCVWLRGGTEEKK